MTKNESNIFFYFMKIGYYWVVNTVVALYSSLMSLHKAALLSLLNVFKCLHVFIHLYFQFRFGAVLTSDLTDFLHLHARNKRNRARTQMKKKLGEDNDEQVRADDEGEITALSLNNEDDQTEEASAANDSHPPSMSVHRTNLLLDANMKASLATFTFEGNTNFFSSSSYL